MIKCEEIFKLKRMLENAKIPFDWISNWGYMDDKMLEEMQKIDPDLIEHYQIRYPSRTTRKRIIDKCYWWFWSIW